MIWYLKWSKFITVHSIIALKQNVICIDNLQYTYHRVYWFISTDLFTVIIIISSKKNCMCLIKIVCVFKTALGTAFIVQPSFIASYHSKTGWVISLSNYILLLCLSHFYTNIFETSFSILHMNSAELYKFGWQHCGKAK